MSKQAWVWTAAAAVAVVVVLSACGGKSAATTTSTSSAEAWASSVCTAFTTWKNSVNSAINSVKAHPSSDTIQKGLKDAEDATNTLTKTLGGLGTPNTASGKTARDTLQNLQKQMEHGINQIKDAVGKVSNGTEAISALATSSTTITTMRSQLDAARATLASLPKDELQHAFETVPACASLRSTS